MTRLKFSQNHEEFVHGIRNLRGSHVHRYNLDSLTISCHQDFLLNSQTMNRCDFDFFFPFSPASAFSVSQNLCHMLMFGRSKVRQHNITVGSHKWRFLWANQVFFFFIIFVGSSTSSLTPPPPGCPNPALVVATRAKTAVSSSSFHHYNLPQCNPRENVYFKLFDTFFC